MKKNFGIVMALVFVLSFGSLVFAQNTNSSTTGGDMSASKTSRGSMGGRRHGRRRGRRWGRRRHGRRRGMGTAKKTGNANTNH